MPAAEIEPEVAEVLLGEDGEPIELEDGEAVDEESTEESDG